MKKGFTLAEVLITLAIIGVVAALTIPSVILNTNQTEYKTALKKAVSVLNQAVSLELAIENLSPSEATDTKTFLDMLQSQMNTISAASDCSKALKVADGTALTGIADYDKCSFTTTDGIQFIFADTASMEKASSGSGSGTGGATTDQEIEQTDFSNGGCTDDYPCYILVDVNGDKNPNQLTTDAGAPKDRFVLVFKGSNGTTVTPAGYGAEVMFAK